MLEHDQKRAGWSARTGGPVWSDGQAEDEGHHKDKRRRPDENGARSCLGGERVQLIPFAVHFSFTFHAYLIPPTGTLHVGRKARLGLPGGVYVMAAGAILGLIGGILMGASGRRRLAAT